MPPFEVEPWSVPLRDPELGTLAAVESVFTLANGHMGLRGTLEEGEPRARPGTYLSGMFEERPLPHAEGGYGYPESGQAVVNVTDGKLIRLTVEDSPFDMRYGEVTSHERVLDLRRGLLTRRTEWTSPNGTSIRVSSRRLVSFTQRTIAAFAYEVEPIDHDVYVAVQSDLLANEPLANPYPGDPRAAAALASPLEAELAVGDHRRAVLVHRTARSGLRVAAGMDHVIDVPDHRSELSLEAAGDLA
ncbi:MAG TPA: family 65 glycosyl hydrolase, partial [Acidimicrobiia bacterium]|nr:family 65 glycosyl hydrolase [Acidimicrobiia bacterium]